MYVNSIIYDFLCFTLDLYILRPFKCLTIFGSTKSIEITSSWFLWVPFVILFFHVFVKHKCDLRLKYALVTLVFLSSNFYLSINDSIVYNNVKLCNRLHFYSPYYISTCNELRKTCLLSHWFILAVSKFKAINNSLLPKIDELRYIAKLSKEAVIRVTESKLDNYILDSENQVDKYHIFRCDKNRKGWGVTCYLKNYLSYIEKDFFPEEIENMFFEILLPKIKPITIGIIYRPPYQSNFLQALNENFAKLDTLKK